MCTISILVPIYGVETFIERCSRSLFEQTYSDLEYVFVDDCTPDRSIDVLKSVLKEYPQREQCVKIIHHEKNRGLAATRNTCLDNASGEWVCIVDSDDWLENHAIRNLFMKQRESDADMILGSRCKHSVDSIVEIHYPNVDKNQRILLNLNGNYMPLTGCIIRKSLFDENAIRWLEGFNMAEDVRMVCLLTYFADKMVSCDDLIYHYDMTNSNSIMHEASDKNKAMQNTYENLQNKLSILDFFSDKEEQYYDKAVEMTVRMLEVVLKQSLKRRNRRVFYEIVDLIDGNLKIARKMRWERSGFKGFLNHSYTFSEMDYQWHRIIKHVVSKSKA